MTTMKEVKEKVGSDSYSCKGGVFTVRQGFFYRHGKTSEDLRNKVLAAFPSAVIIDSGEVYKPFRSWATLANQSHWYVKFTVRS